MIRLRIEIDVRWLDYVESMYSLPCWHGVNDPCRHHVSDINVERIPNVTRFNPVFPFFMTIKTDLLSGVNHHDTEDVAVVLTFFQIPLLSKRVTLGIPVWRRFVSLKCIQEYSVISEWFLPRFILHLSQDHVTLPIREKWQRAIIEYAEAKTIVEEALC
jgi:hypothetical protein